MEINIYNKLFHYYNNLSIAKKLKFMGVSTVALVGTISIFFILIYQYSNEKALLENHVKTLTMVVADNIAPAVLFDDTEQIGKILISLRHKDEVQHAYVLGKKSNVLGSYHSAQTQSIDKEILEDLNSNDVQQWRGMQLYTLVAINADSQQVGSIVIVASIYAFIYQMLLEILVLTLIVVASILVTYKYRALLRDSILKPIAQLNILTSKIIETKNLSNKIPVYNQDEIGELAKNFNSMLDDLDKTHSELNRQKDSLAYKAHHDALTGLPNRALFNDRLEQAISKAKRHKEKIALFFIDLDHFKEINDTLGHEVGDEVLKFFAKRLKASVRTEDTIARLGGDEFMVIMENLQNPEAISVVANKIVSIVKEPIVLGEQTLNLGTSIGISVYPQNGETSEVLIKNADTAMYKAKDEGRDNYQFYTPQMKQLALERMENEAALRSAIEKEELTLYYQPQFDVHRDEVSGYEADVKWQHPQKGLIDFSDFKQLAVEMGALIKIEQWIVKAALQEAGHWRVKGVMPKRIILNLSMKIVMEKEFAAELKGMMDQYGCRPEEVEIGVRESELLNNQKRSIEALQTLRNMGLKLTINGFGVTDTSLTYLSRLPIHNLKISGTLTANVSENSVVVKAVSALAKSMGLKLIAEGVETTTEKEFLKDHGYDLMQGTLFGTAISAAEMGKN
ncbi:MAG: diguanylate cyclase [Sulfurimonadaceae bacterium]